MKNHANELLVTSSMPSVQACSAKEIVFMNPHPETLPTDIEENRGRVQSNVHSGNGHEHNHHAISN